MSRRLCVRVSDELAARIDARAQRHAETRSAVVRDVLASGVPVSAGSSSFDELMRRAAALRARQSTPSDTAALIREARGRMPLRLQLMRLTVPFLAADLL